MWIILSIADVSVSTLLLPAYALDAALEAARGNAGSAGDHARACYEPSESIFAV